MQDLLCKNCATATYHVLDENQDTLIGQSLQNLSRQIVYLTWKEFTLYKTLLQINTGTVYIYIATSYSHEQTSTKLCQYKLALVSDQ